MPRYGEPFKETPNHFTCKLCDKETYTGVWYEDRPCKCYWERTNQKQLNQAAEDRRADERDWELDSMYDE